MGMGTKLLLIGAGGHCLSVLDSLDTGAFDGIGICDLPGRVGEQVAGIPVVGSDGDLPALYAAGYTAAFLTLGSVGRPGRRMDLYARLRALRFSFPVIADPTAVVSPRARVGEGTFVGKGAILNADAAVGACCILNSGTIIEHGCRLGDFVHTAPGSVLCGQVTVGTGAHVGAGASVIQGVSIGDGAVIGAGAVVIRDIPAGATAVGNPCRILPPPSSPT